MIVPQKSKDIGMKRGRILANLNQSQQLDMIAEGLPILMKSAGELLEASKALSEHYRSAEILKGHALEEIAKILILVDIVRCPPKIRSERIGQMMTWFYDHLARLIYIDAQCWSPVDINGTAQPSHSLQKYVNSERKTHYVEGFVGEYIMPNSAIWRRESLLYADIVAHDDGTLQWNEPQAYLAMELSFLRDNNPRPWRVCQALHDMGAFSRKGLDIISSVWEKLDFQNDQTQEDARRLTYEMLTELEKADLISASAREEQLETLYNGWQLPMYRVDFTRIEVSLEELRAEQERMFQAEVGY